MKNLLFLLLIFPTLTLADTCEDYFTQTPLNIFSLSDYRKTKADKQIEREKLRIERLAKFHNIDPQDIRNYASMVTIGKFLFPQGKDKFIFQAQHVEILGKELEKQAFPFQFSLDHEKNGELRIKAPTKNILPHYLKEMSELILFTFYPQQVTRQIRSIRTKYSYEVLEQTASTLTLKIDSEIEGRYGIRQTSRFTFTKNKNGEIQELRYIQYSIEEGARGIRFLTDKADETVRPFSISKDIFQNFNDQNQIAALNRVQKFLFSEASQTQLTFSSKSWQEKGSPEKPWDMDFSILLDLESKTLRITSAEAESSSFSILSNIYNTGGERNLDLTIDSISAFYLTQQNRSLELEFKKQEKALAKIIFIKNAQDQLEKIRILQFDEFGFSKEIRFMATETLKLPPQLQEILQRTVDSTPSYQTEKKDFQATLNSIQNFIFNGTSETALSFNSKSWQQKGHSPQAWDMNFTLTVDPKNSTFIFSPNSRVSFFEYVYRNIHSGQIDHFFSYLRSPDSLKIKEQRGHTLVLESLFKTGNLPVLHYQITFIKNDQGIVSKVMILNLDRSRPAEEMRIMAQELPAEAFKAQIVSTKSDYEIRKEKFKDQLNSLKSFFFLADSTETTFTFNSKSWQQKDQAVKAWDMDFQIIMDKEKDIFHIGPNSLNHFLSYAFKNSPKELEKVFSHYAHAFSEFSIKERTSSSLVIEYTESPNVSPDTKFRIVFIKDRKGTLQKIKIIKLHHSKPVEEIRLMHQEALEAPTETVPTASPKQSTVMTFPNLEKSAYQISRENFKHTLIFIKNFLFSPEDSQDTFTFKSKSWQRKGQAVKSWDMNFQIQFDSQTDSFHFSPVDKHYFYQHTSTAIPRDLFEIFSLFANRDASLSIERQTKHTLELSYHNNIEGSKVKSAQITLIKNEQGQIYKIKLQKLENNQPVEEIRLMSNETPSPSPEKKDSEKPSLTHVPWWKKLLRL